MSDQVAITQWNAAAVFLDFCGIAQDYVQKKKLRTVSEHRIPAQN